MAIKGKKKSQQRGSQARRRPAMAPRPVTGRSQKPPWYKTTKGQTLAAISTLLLLVVILVMVNNSRKEAAELKTTQDSLDNYTEQVTALLERITPPASEMAAAAQTAPEEDLAADSEQWVTMFTGAQTETAQFLAPEEATTAGQLFTQAVNLYRAAAESMVVAASLEGKQQEDLLSAASTQVQSASGVWEAAVSALDKARDEVELDASGLRSPTATPPSSPEMPAPSATIPVEPEEDGGGGGGKSGGDKNKKGDDS